MEKHSSGLDDFLTELGEEAPKGAKKSKKSGFLRRWWKGLSKSDRRFYAIAFLVVLVAVGLLVFSAIRSNQPVEDDVVDIVEGESTDEGLEGDGRLDEEVGEVVDVQPMSGDFLPGDEMFAIFVKLIREEWGDGSNPKVTNETSTNSLVYSFRGVTDLPDINKLYARVAPEEVDGGMGGVTFYTPEGKSVVSFFFDNTAIREGDQGLLRASRVTFYSLEGHNPKRLPLSNRTSANLKTEVNKMCKAVFSPTAKSKVDRWAKYKRLFVGERVVAENFLPVSYYEPLYLFTDYAEPSDGIYVKCQPSLGAQAMLVKFVENPNSQSGYLIESVKQVPIESAMSPDHPYGGVVEEPPSEGEDE